jgi:hypothetical protein
MNKVGMNKSEIEPTFLQNEVAFDKALQSWQDGQSSPIFTIKTGVFIQSLTLFNSTDVNLSGYIWQHYPDSMERIKLKEGEVGFILPEQVSTGNDISPREVYRIRENNEETIGWYFEARLRQPFDYALYPFDHKTLSVRLWAKDFADNVILVPDYQAYNTSGANNIFGIEKEIVLKNWHLDGTYFDYKYSDYDTNFGIDNYIGPSGFPELRYNLVIKRKFENAFMVYVLPLFLVAILLFTALLIVNDKKRHFTKIVFSTSRFIVTAACLFLVVVLLHTQLRKQFLGGGIVYIEYFYILIYVLLVLATLHVYLFSVRTGGLWGLIVWRDNLISKIIFWPLLLSAMILITLVVR